MNCYVCDLLTKAQLKRVILSSVALFVVASVTIAPSANAFAQETATVEKSKKAGEKQEKAEQDDDREKARQERAKKRDAKKKMVNEFAHFMRVKKDRRGRPVSMETSVTRYIGKNDKGEIVTVDLIGVVHIGEKKYYEDLNKRFEQYDGLLYELVAPEGTVIPKGGRAEGQESAGMNPVAMLQKGMQKSLGLQFQLEHVDYTKNNFIHADMTPEEFAESMSKNNESMSRILMKAMSQSMAQSASGSGPSDFEMIAALMSSNREVKLRRIMASQMQNMEGSMSVFEGDEGSTIIDYRNKKCMDIFRREMNSGKKNLAIFYGAGHLPDMQRRLQSEFKFKRGGQYWMEAWNLKTPPKKPKSEPESKSESKTKKK